MRLHVDRGDGGMDFFVQRGRSVSDWQSDRVNKQAFQTE